MKRAMLGIVIGVSVTAGGWAQGLAAVPVHGKPVWQVVQSSPEAPGSPIAVRSLETNQVIGSIPVDSKFLSFGNNGQIVTMAYNGEIAYVPSTIVARLYPQIIEPVSAPGGPATLEELADEYEEKVTGSATVSLRPSNSIVERVSQSGIVGTGAVPGNPGVAFGGGEGVNAFAGPGAALAGGGVQAVGGMAGAGGGYIGGANPGYPGGM